VSLVRLAARLAQQGDRLGRGVLLAVKPATKRPPRISPRARGAGSTSADRATAAASPPRAPTVARTPLPSGATACAPGAPRSPRRGVIGSGVPSQRAILDQRPGVHPEQRDAPPPPTAMAVCAIGGKQQGAQPAKLSSSPGRAPPARRALPPPAWAGAVPGDLIEEGSPCADRYCATRCALADRCVASTDAARVDHRRIFAARAARSAWRAPAPRARRVAAAGAEPRPHETTASTAHEPGGFVLTDAVGQDLGLPGAGRRFESFELRQNCAHCVGSLHATLSVTRCHSNRKRTKSRASIGSISARRRRTCSGGFVPAAGVRTTQWLPARPR